MSEDTDNLLQSLLLNLDDCQQFRPKQTKKYVNISCFHEKTLLDHATDTEICTLCGLVTCEQVMLNNDAEKSINKEHCRWYCELYDLCQNMNVVNSLFEQSFSYFKKIQKILAYKTDPRKMRDLIAYSLYHILNTQSGGRSTDEVMLHVEVSSPKIFERIHNALAAATAGQYNADYDPLNMLQRYCIMLGLPNKAFLKITHFTEEVKRRLFLQTRRDQSICAVCIHYCCVADITYRRVQLKEICGICQVSLPHTRSILRSHKGELDAVLRTI